MDPRFARLALALLLVVVTGGALLAFIGPTTSQGAANSAHPRTQSVGGPLYALSSSFGAAALNAVSGPAQMLPSTTVIPSPAVSYASHPGPAASGSASGVSPQSSLEAPNVSRSIEFFSNLTLQADSPSSALERTDAVAYSLGGYVAYSTESADQAYVVIRVPAASFQAALGRVESLGKVVSAVTSSNDVTVKYTDLNATLDSLVGEQASLLNLLDRSTSINETLNIESTLQKVNAEVNQVQSQILQTRRLIDYATISAEITRSQTAAPLSLRLVATPRSGMSPLSVTFNAAVTGGTAPYVVNYNFGDGTSAMGNMLIHTFVQPGRFNVTATVTDSSGNVSEAWTTVAVAPSPVASGLGGFPAFVANLFLRVVEGMVEVAVVALPIALVVMAVILPVSRRFRSARRRGVVGPSPAEG